MFEGLNGRTMRVSGVRSASCRGNEGTRVTTELRGASCRGFRRTRVAGQLAAVSIGKNPINELSYTYSNGDARGVPKVFL